LQIAATDEEKFGSLAAYGAGASHEVDTMEGRCRMMMSAQRITGTTARKFLR
jgi:hypothetical protein